MSNEFPNIERIESYILGRMSVQEQKAFEADVSADAELKAEYESLKAVIEGIRTAPRHKAIRAQFDAWEGQAAAEPPVAERPAQVSKPAWRFYALAAVLIVLVSIGGWQFLMPEKPDSASIFASYYKPFPGTLIASTTRSNTSVTRNDSLLRQGAYYYDQGGFEQAIQTFALIPDSFEQYNKVQFLRGLAYLADGEEALARSSLAPVMADSTSNLYEPASWYTALVCIKQEDKLCAVSHLEGLVKAESPDFAKEAKKILAELDL